MGVVIVSASIGVALLLLWGVFNAVEGSYAFLIAGGALIILAVAKLIAWRRGKPSSD